MTHQFYMWDGMPVKIEWYEGPCTVDAITRPAEHPEGRVPEGERHALVWLLPNESHGWWASEEAVHEHAERIGPPTDMDWQ